MVLCNLLQSLVLLSDLATVLDLQGKHDEALAHVKKAVELGQAAGHPDQHVLIPIFNIFFINKKYKL